MKKALISILLSTFTLFSTSQNCIHTLKGKVFDETTKEILPGAAIYLEEQNKAVYSDKQGNFTLTNLCPCDNCHIRISHLGCETKRILISITKDTTLSIPMHHHVELIDEVVVHGEVESSEISSTIQKSALVKEGNKNLADALSSIEGVSTLKNGSGISKPIVHGLFGNRVSIMNNGIPHSGQRWGNDHAPEIDLFIADHLSVVKGSSSLAYAGSSLGSVVLVEVDPIPNDPHIHGQTNYIYETNGQGHTGNVQLENANKIINWRITATAKRTGDQHTPDYFLNNTGRKENDIAIQLERKITNDWKPELYYSYVNAEIGILRGSLVSTTVDLESSFDREEPFRTQESFSRGINPPRQLINHHLLKVKNTYYLNDTSYLSLTYGGQWNDRKEFDNRRGGRSEIPAVFMQQSQQFAELNYQRKLKNNTNLKTGIQYTYIFNSNDNETTGRLPLIPQYTSYNPAIFSVLQKEKGKLFSEIGFRYAFIYRDVRDITSTVPRTIQQFTNEYHNLGINAGLKYRWNDKIETTFNTGIIYRAPEVNELHSFGVHQSAASFERGDPNLKTEKSVKLILSNKLLLHKNIHIQLLTYFQRVNDFIYVQPERGDTNTIRGAFRFFDYKQADVNIYGLDAKLTIEPIEQIKLVTKYALVRGDNLDDNLPLVNMPADNILSKLSYFFKNGNTIHNTKLSIGSKYVFKQRRISVEDGQDFFETPDGYFLLHASAETKVQLKSSSIKFNCTVENMLNTTYRDYLNRLRYFSDEIGRSIILGVSYEF